MSESPDHDPWCPWDEDAPTSVCQCDLIAKVRADEREAWLLLAAVDKVRMNDLRAKVTALPQDGGGRVWRADVLDLIDGGSDGSTGAAMDKPDEPLLGLATTEQLFREIITRFALAGRYPGPVERALVLAEMLGGLSAQDREYRTVDSE